MTAAVRWLAWRAVGLLILLVAATVYGPGSSSPCTDWPVAGGLRGCPAAAPLGATSAPDAQLQAAAIGQGWTCMCVRHVAGVCIPPAIPRRTS